MSVSEAGDVQGRRKPGNSRVEMRVQAADADGAVQPSTDLNQAIAMYTSCELALYLPLVYYSVYTTIWWIDCGSI